MHIHIYLHTHLSLNRIIGLKTQLNQTILNCLSRYCIVTIQGFVIAKYSDPKLDLSNYFQVYV